MYKYELKAMIDEGKAQNMNIDHLLSMVKDCKPCLKCGDMGIFLNDICDRCF